MKLTLDHTQRLNLHALLGAQRADVGSIRTIWAMQARHARSRCKRGEALESKREMTGGQQRVVSNADLSLPAKEFELSDLEAARIRSALQEWESYAAGVDRRWLQPLVDVLFPIDLAWG